LPALIERTRRAACDLLLEKELNTIANAPAEAPGQRLVPKKKENLHEINVKRADFGQI
jgi:hypothetical protein